MSDQHTPEIDPDEEVTESVEVSLYPEDAPEKAMLQLGAGLQPFILVRARPHDEEENHLIWEFFGSCLDDNDELLEHLEWAVNRLQVAVAQERARADAAEGIEDAVVVVEDQP